MTFDWTTFALQAVNALILLAILRHFLFRPVAAIIARRQAETDAAMAAAAEARAKAEAEAAAARAEAEATRLARADLLARAEGEAGTLRAGLLDAARAEAAKIAAQGRAEADRSVAAGRDAALARARDLAGTIAARALSDMPQPPDAAGYAQSLARALAALGSGERAAILAGANLRLAVPAPLTRTEEAAVTAALVPFGIRPPVETDAALIAGLDLRSDAGRVRNSLAHDLDTIAKALADDADA